MKVRELLEALAEYDGSLDIVVCVETKVGYHCEDLCCPVYGEDRDGRGHEYKLNLWGLR